MKFKIAFLLFFLITMNACMNSTKENITVIETSKSGNQLTERTDFELGASPS